MALEDLTTEELHERINNDRKTYVDAIPEKDKAGAVTTYRKYAKGEQLVTIKAAVADYLEGSTKHLFADNVMHQVIAEAADRILLLGFRVQNEDVQTFLTEEIFTKNHLDDISGETHYAALRDADFALMPAWSESAQRIIIHKEDWWDGDSGMFVAYDEQGNMLYAVKEWSETEGSAKTFRRTVYFDDRIERFRGSGIGAWEPFQLETDSDWPVPWKKRDDKPLHIPVIHFANGGRGPGNYGVSELGGGVLGNQDSLNDKRYDIDVAARMTAFQMITASNYKPIVDKAGNPIPPTVGPGAFLASGGDTKWGVIEAGDISQLENTYKLVLRAICRMTRTPLHAIIGEWPSGEALLRAELPAVNKARRQVAKFTTAWATLAHRCVEISNAFGMTNLDEEAMITPQFAPVTQLGELQKAMSDQAFWTGAKQAVEAGYPLAMYLEDAGWSKDRIDAFKREMRLQENAARDAEEEAIRRMVDSAADDRDEVEA